MLQRVGKAGNIKGWIDPKGNIFEGPRRRDYPMPPLRDTEPKEQRRGPCPVGQSAALERAGI